MTWADLQETGTQPVRPDITLSGLTTGLSVTVHIYKDSAFEALSAARAEGLTVLVGSFADAGLLRIKLGGKTKVFRGAWERMFAFRLPWPITLYPVRQPKVILSWRQVGEWFEVQLPNWAFTENTAYEPRMSAKQAKQPAPFVRPPTPEIESELLPPAAIPKPPVLSDKDMPKAWVAERRAKGEPTKSRPKINPKPLAILAPRTFKPPSKVAVTIKQPKPRTDTE